MERAAGHAGVVGVVSRHIHIHLHDGAERWFVETAEDPHITVAGPFASIAAAQAAKQRLERERDEPLRLKRDDGSDWYRGTDAAVTDAGGDPANMQGSAINSELDRLDRESSQLNDQMIAAGRGHERPSEYLKMSDPLATKLRANYERRMALRNEIDRRYGPGAPSRLPRGFGPLRAIDAGNFNKTTEAFGRAMTARRAEKAQETQRAAGNTWQVRKRQKNGVLAPPDQFSQNLSEQRAGERKVALEKMNPGSSYEIVNE